MHRSNVTIDPQPEHQYRHLRNWKVHLHVTQGSVRQNAENFDIEEVSKKLPWSFILPLFIWLQKKARTTCAARAARKTEIHTIASLKLMDDRLLRDMGIEHRWLIGQFVQLGRTSADKK